MNEAQQRVAQGIEWLDGHIPDWFIKVDPATLDIASLNSCMLGQLAVAEGIYDEGDGCGTPFGVALLEWFSGKAVTADINRLGFDILHVDPNELNEEWRDRINERRLEASVTPPSHD